jgi:hypothetical protein
LDLVARQHSDEVGSRMARVADGEDRQVFGGCHEPHLVGERPLDGPAGANRGRFWR